MDRIGISQLDAEVITSEIVSSLSGDWAFKCYANVETPLYEKVVCQIPVLVLDNENRPVLNRDLTRLR